MNPTFVLFPLPHDPETKKIVTVGLIFLISSKCNRYAWDQCCHLQADRENIHHPTYLP